MVNRRSACLKCRRAKAKCNWTAGSPRCDRCITRKTDDCLIEQVDLPDPETISITKWYTDTVISNGVDIVTGMPKSALIEFAMEAFEACITGQTSVQYYIDTTPQLFTQTPVLTTISRQAVVAYLHLLFLPQKAVPNRVYISACLSRMAMSLGYQHDPNTVVIWQLCVLWDRWISRCHNVPGVIPPDTTTTLLHPLFGQIWDTIMAPQFSPRDLLPLVSSYPNTSLYEDAARL